jgi:biotin transporter BioY
MAHVVARLITIPALMIGSTWLIARYRAVGVAISILAGWAILYFVYHAWPAPPPEWDEDREEIHYTAPILMALWCIPVWAFVIATSRTKKQIEKS